MSIVVVTKNCTLQNVYSTWTLLPNPTFNLSLVFSSTANLTATLQRKFGSTGTAVDVDNWTASAEEVGNAGVEAEVYWRFGCKTGNYTAGSFSGRLSQ